jgi:energy-coupling factor transport system permease protein
MSIDAAPVGPRRGHPSAWLAWTACAVSAALLVRNPWYLLLLGGLAIVLRWHVTREAPARTTFVLLGTLLVTSTLINLLFSRAGATVLVELPIGWLGGPYTLEAAVFGIVAGLQIGAVLLIMLVFSAVVAPADLLRRTPPGLYPIGVVGMLGLTFAPQARRSYLDLMEARRVRGQAPQGLREARASVEPLVILSLERAVAQAEGLVARGWGAQQLHEGRRRLSVVGWLGLAIGLGVWALQPARPAIGLAFVAAAAVLVGLSLRGAPGRYRPEVWRFGDGVTAALSGAAGILLVGLMVGAPQVLSYYPYPELTWPLIHPAPALVVVLLAGPLAGMRRG